MVTECPPPVHIGHGGCIVHFQKDMTWGWLPRLWSGGRIPTLRNAFKARMAALSSKQLMCCSASSMLQCPPVYMPLQVAPQPSDNASVLMERLNGGGVMS